MSSKVQEPSTTEPVSALDRLWRSPVVRETDASEIVSETRGVDGGGWAIWVDGLLPAPKELVSFAGGFDPAEELPHEGLIDEWVFATWQPDGSFGVIVGHRLLGGHSWYWCALVESGQPLLHLSEWQVLVRAIDPFIVKAPEMWAENHADAPFEQWSLGNEAYFVALEEPDDALGRAYGVPTPVAMDLEWYGTAPVVEIPLGYEQVGVVHGEIELLHRPNLQLAELPAHRWRRWGVSLPPLVVAEPVGLRPDGAGKKPSPADTSPAPLLRAPFGFPDSTISSWELTTAGWRTG